MMDSINKKQHMNHLISSQSYNSSDMRKMMDNNSTPIDGRFKLDIHDATGSRYNDNEKNASKESNGETVKDINKGYGYKGKVLNDRYRINRLVSKTNDPSPTNNSATNHSVSHLGADQSLLSLVDALKKENYILRDMLSKKIDEVSKLKEHINELTTSKHDHVTKHEELLRMMNSLQKEKEELTFKSSIKFKSMMYNKSSMSSMINNNNITIDINDKSKDNSNRPLNAPIYKNNNLSIETSSRKKYNSNGRINIRKDMINSSTQGKKNIVIRDYI